jgi:hypothetical protein
MLPARRRFTAKGCSLRGPFARARWSFGGKAAAKSSPMPNYNECWKGQSTGAVSRLARIRTSSSASLTRRGTANKDRAGGCNHSCDSNLWMQDAFTVCARQDIAAGEELTLDEALIGVDPDWSMESCNCGSPYCRGHVTGNDWRPPELQKRYSGHFSPFINTLIAREQGGAPTCRDAY